MRVIDDGLEKGTWVVQTGASVNPIPSSAFIPTLLPSGALKVTNVSTSAFGGALVTNKRPVPSIPGIFLPYLGLDLQVYVSSFDLPVLGRLEIDVKVVSQSAPNASTQIPNVFNFSSQLNLSTGSWQIDTSPPGWIDTGFKPTLAPDTWTPISFRYFIDVPNNKFSMLSTTWGATEFSVPSNLQELPSQTSNWSSVAAIQLQTETLVPGGLNTLYKNIQLTWSDVAF
jgi:hypothetical protein